MSAVVGEDNSFFFRSEDGSESSSKRNPVWIDRAQCLDLLEACRPLCREALNRGRVNGELGDILGRCRIWASESFADRVLNLAWLRRTGHPLANEVKDFVFLYLIANESTYR